jgi:type IV pilus biogenesis protein CpaD/CtpE
MKNIDFFIKCKSDIISAKTEECGTYFNELSPIGIHTINDKKSKIVVLECLTAEQKDLCIKHGYILYQFKTDKCGVVDAFINPNKLVFTFTRQKDYSL